MQEDDLCKDEDINEAHKRHELFHEGMDAMDLTLDQRRELMDWIMREAWNAAREATPGCDNIYADTDEADELREKRFQIVIEKMLELKKCYGFPISKYDRARKRAFNEFADGHREYFDER